MSMHGDPLMEPENRKHLPDEQATADTTDRTVPEDPTGHADSVTAAGRDAGDAGHGTCPHCGTEMITGTIDFAGTPDETAEVDVERATLQPGQMVTAAICPNPECPGQEPDTGARI